MDVCQHQSLSSDNTGSEVQSIQQPSELQLLVVSEEAGSYTGNVKPVRKRKRDSEASQSDAR